jgi:hypothetical protein
MRVLAITALALVLTGCTSIPVGTVAVCVGVCRFDVKAPPPQSAAEKAGAAAGGLLQDFLTRGGK